MKNKPKIQAYKKGLSAEKKCLFWLRCHGYHLCELRYKTKVGEIDLIMRRGKNIVFIEVKARNSFAEGLESISLKAQKRIQKAAQYFIVKNANYMKYQMRFDAMIVTPHKILPFWVKNAWQ